MKYTQIKSLLERLQIFTSHDLYLVDSDFRQPTLSEWVKKGYVIQLRQNHYCFPDYQPSGKDLYFVANQLYQPSYISLEMALNHYGIIPEVVQTITSITTLKTQDFETCIGNFSYQSIAKRLFWGYQIIKTEERHAQIAYFEKAILDYLYLHPEMNTLDAFTENRWNVEVLQEKLDLKRLEVYQNIFNSHALNDRSAQLLNYIDS